MIIEIEHDVYKSLPASVHKVIEEIMVLQEGVMGGTHRIAIQDHSLRKLEKALRRAGIDPKALQNERKLLPGPGETDQIQL